MSFVARIDQCGLVSQSGVYEHCAACFPILVPWSSGLLTSIRPDVHLSSASATSHTNDRGAAQCSWKQLSFVGQRSCPGRQGFLDRPRIYRRKEKLLLQISGEESEESSEESDASAKLGYVDHEIPIDVRVPPHRHCASDGSACGSLGAVARQQPIALCASGDFPIHRVETNLPKQLRRSHSWQRDAAVHFWSAIKCVTPADL